MAGQRSTFGGGGGGGSMMKPRKRAEETDLDITPMIDVTFLLLIFFMVASTMQSTPERDLPPAKYSIGVMEKNATIIAINRPIAPGDDPVVVLSNGEECTPDDRDAIRDDVENGILDEKNEVIIQADREVPAGVVKKVMRAVSDIDGIKFSIGVKKKN
ncbi:Biopolymer transport protein ExbD/TolR [hydrothermal vent metagenome]|uniref:Biopolymer transport protein ExbD/TolR n=1 Tax=hydrothermal vent metagenome TaxID=652676 RepID=A0A3B1DKG4_9ZZZZ